MKLYELTNPSDATTFYAPDFRTAAMAVGIVGAGAYGCVELGVDGEPERMPPLIGDDWFVDKFGTSFAVMLEQMDKPTVIAALRSFAYTQANVNRRKEYDELISRADDPEARRGQWEDEHRSSMTTIVKYAWANADALQKVEDGSVAQR